MIERLVSGQVLRLEARMRITRLRVLEGCLWLTTTPADGDVLLRAGDVWDADDRWPIVVQAVADATAAVESVSPGLKTRGSIAPRLYARATMNDAWSRKPSDS